MSKSVNPIPEPFTAVTPYLMVRDGSRQIRFLMEAFGARQRSVTRGPKGEIRHAQLDIDGAMLMLGEVFGDWPAMPGSLYLYVPDTDATYRQALAAGGESVMEPADQFYGDRSAGVRDPNGNVWWIATHFEDVAPEEIERRAAEESPPG